VGESKAVLALEQIREAGECPAAKDEELAAVYDLICAIPGFEELKPVDVGFGSTIYANKPGDGSAREQAASCQRVVGAWANIAQEYATKRYRSNCINWGIVPFLTKDKSVLAKGAYIFVPDVRKAVLEGNEAIKAFVIRGGKVTETVFSIGGLTADERKVGLSNWQPCM
jgi:aconitate hydratase